MAQDQSCDWCGQRLISIRAAALSAVLGMLWHAPCVAQESQKTEPPAASSYNSADEAALPALPANLGRLPQPPVAPPVNRHKPTLVHVTLECKSVTGLLADGVGYQYWTYNGTVPGPMIRVRQGDTVELTLHNATDSLVSHSIDSHGVLGPGGGGAVTQTPPGATSVFQFKAMKPGVFIYHCATPMIPYHLAHGMYGLMVVEPPGGWPKVDREFYVMQGDMYLNGDPTQSGVHEAAVDKMVKETPDFVVFNGSAGSLGKEHPLKAKVGETVRIFFGNAGPNDVSSFHVIGEIFDKVHPEGACETLSNVQSTLVPAGGATMVEFKTVIPGRYILVDHSLGRLQKGAVGFLDVEGEPNPQVFQSFKAGSVGSDGH
ncbi:copper-containing nitrite reductase [Methylacidimicrobium tartarophylax]|uniref:Copper-containing nitrite reductase n=1 Tax=Methylacidimicrobium tartarophylax TaxID=1041768 RepID=A0A5E6MMU1_9BACT|nr:copper-containing nitrite reductase [Methylacidimicrobium tartarophylax]VVM07361.1 nitrite reductase (NO-forming) [Methylacidimicrobium tartarophylax]